VGIDKDTYLGVVACLPQRPHLQNTFKKAVERPQRHITKGSHQKESRQAAASQHTGPYVCACA